MSSDGFMHVAAGRRGKLSLRRKTNGVECSVIHDVLHNNAAKTNEFSVADIHKKDENQQVSSSASARATEQVNNRPGELTRSQNTSSLGDQSKHESSSCLLGTKCSQISFPELPPWYGLKEKEQDKRTNAELIKIGDISLEWHPLPTHCQKCLFISKHKRAAQPKESTSTLTAQKSTIKSVQSLIDSGNPCMKDGGIGDSTIVNQKRNFARNENVDISLQQSERFNVNVKKSIFMKSSPEISQKNKIKVTSDKSHHSDMSKKIVGQSFPRTSPAPSKKQTQVNQHSRSPSQGVVVVSVSGERSENESHRPTGTKRTLAEASASDHHQNAAKKPRLANLAASASGSLAAELKPKPISTSKYSGNQMKQPAAMQNKNSQMRLDSMLHVARNSTSFSSQTSTKTLQTSGKSVVPIKASPNRENPNSSNQASAQKFPVQGRNSSGTYTASTKSTPLASNVKALFKKTHEQVTGFVGDSQNARSRLCTMESQPPHKNTSTITAAASQPDNHPTPRQDIRPIKQNLTAHSHAQSAIINKTQTNKINTSSHIETEFRTAGKVGTNRTVFPQHGAKTTGNAWTASTSGHESKVGLISYQYLGPGSHQQTTSKESEIIQSCPLCPFKFPSSWTSFQRDGHIAVCLSTSSDDTTW